MTIILIYIFRVIALIISIVVWAVVGLIIWAFLMIRHMSVLTFMSTIAAFSKRTDLSRAIKNMESAVSFYPSGFVRIFKSFTDQDVDSQDGQLFSSIGRFVLETISAVIFFWVPIILITRNDIVQDLLYSLPDPLLDLFSQ